jgi:dTDP-4-dehydrorhamnose 3,5-epimerase
MGLPFRHPHTVCRGIDVKFIATPLSGAFLIDIEAIEDERGFFARSVCVDEFARHGLNARFVQQSVSFNKRTGTLRGMHYQAAPHEEEKLVRVTRGAIYDVIVDLRRNSPTMGRWFGVELSADNHRQLYIPQGFAHGFQTLCPDTEILYEMTAPFQPDASRGFRWDDRQVGITWPAFSDRTISSKDRSLPFFSELP